MANAFTTIVRRCSCGFETDTDRNAAIHVTLAERHAVERGNVHSIPHVFTLMEVPVEVFLPVAAPTPEQMHLHDGEEQAPGQHDHAADAGQLAAPHHMDAVAGNGSPSPVPVAHIAGDALEPVAPLPGIPVAPQAVQNVDVDYGPFRTWSSLQIARFYVDWDISRAKILQLVMLLNDRRFKGADVNASFIRTASVNNVRDVMESEKAKYGVSAPVPFLKQNFTVDGIEYEFFYRDLVQVALQLFATSTTTADNGFQYKAAPIFEDGCRVYTTPTRCL